MNKAFQIALEEYGTKGVLGANNNARILTYFTQAGFKQVKDDETAWCAAFINFCLDKAGANGSGSLMARSFLKYGKESPKPKIGDLVVLWRGTKDGTFGHVGFFVNETATTVYILGGNQSNEVNIKEFPKAQVLSYRAIGVKK